MLAGDRIDSTLAEIQGILKKLQAEARKVPPPGQSLIADKPIPDPPAPPAAARRKAAPGFSRLSGGNTLFTPVAAQGSPARPAEARPSLAPPPPGLEAAGPIAPVRPPAPLPVRGGPEAAPAAAPKAPPPFFSALLQPIQTAMTGSPKEAALQTLRSAVATGLPYVGEDFQEWAKRIEFEIDLLENGDPIYSILTVQPLYQTYDKEHTVFTQLRADERTVNAGVGYRRTLMANNVLVGVNSFYDIDKESNKRAGYGAELKWSAFDLRANAYEGLSHRHSVGGGVDEEPLSGFDIEVASQVPYLPWARVIYSRNFWNARDAKNVRGYRLGVEMDLHPNLQIEVGIADDTARDQEVYAQLRFHLGDRKVPTASHVQWIDPVPFRGRDMRDQALVKVRRQNAIAVERTLTAVQGSVVITRAD